MNSEYIAEQFEHNGYVVKIIQDQDAQAPDDTDDNGLFIVTTRNRHFQVLHKYKHDGISRADMDAQACVEDTDLRKRYWVFPLYAYIHSGIALSLGRQGQFGDMWDSGQIGFVFAAKDEWRYQYRERKKCVSAHTAAKGLVETWNQYLGGQVYGFTIEQPNGDDVDSCWGFYGFEYCKQEAIECVPDEPATNAEECDELEDTLS